MMVKIGIIGTGVPEHFVKALAEVSTYHNIPTDSISVVTESESTITASISKTSSYTLIEKFPLNKFPETRRERRARLRKQNKNAKTRQIHKSKNYK